MRVCWRGQRRWMLALPAPTATSGGDEVLGLGLGVTSHQSHASELPLPAPANVPASVSLASLSYLVSTFSLSRLFHRAKTRAIHCHQPSSVIQLFCTDACPTLPPRRRAAQHIRRHCAGHLTRLGLSAMVTNDNLAGPLMESPSTAMVVHYAWLDHRSATGGMNTVP